MDSPSPSQGFACSACGPKKSPSQKLPSPNYEHFLPSYHLVDDDKSYKDLERCDEDVERSHDDNSNVNSVTNLEDYDDDGIKMTEPTEDYEYFDYFEHDQEVMEPKVKIKKKWNGNTASFNEFYDPQIDDLYLPRSYRRKWILFGSTQKIAKKLWKSA